MSEKECWVYVIAPKTADGYGSPVKIGMSDNPGYRLMSLQSGSPVKLGIAYQFRMPKRAMAREIERAMLDVNKDKRLHGEWLDMSASQAVLDCACAIMVTIESPNLSAEIQAACLRKTGAAFVLEKARA